MHSGYSYASDQKSLDGDDIGLKIERSFLAEDEFKISLKL
jgi:hypothetical protein